MARSKSQERLTKALQESVLKHVQYYRRSGSLGAGTLKHAKVKELVQPLLKKLKRAPRAPTCKAALEKVNRALALCPANKDPQAWFNQMNVFLEMMLLIFA